jgi:anti-sigma regulatory factor (Ser/Thr protein kinase)
MKEISLHLLDLIENSVAAGAERVDIDISEDEAGDALRIVVTDNGRGLPADLLQGAADPFATTRATRNVGLGLPLLAAAAERAGGHFDVTSSPEKGTVVHVEMQISHIDRSPLGRIDETLSTAAVLHPTLDIRFCHSTVAGQYRVDTSALPDIGSPAALRRQIVQLVHDGRARIRSTA